MRRLQLCCILLAAFPNSIARAGEPPAGREALSLRKDIGWRRDSGHGKVITALAYTPDSKTLAAASLDGTVRLWDADATKVLRTLRTSSLEVYAIAISPDGKYLASAGSWSEIQIWNLANGQEVHLLKGHEGPVAALAFSPDGKLLASGGYDRSIRFWDTANWTEKLKFGEGLNRVTTLAFSPDGKLIASGGTTVEVTRGHHNGTSDKIRLWNVAGGTLHSELPMRGSQVSFFPDGHSIIAAGTVIHYTPQKNGGVVIDGHDVTTWVDLTTRREYLNTFKESRGEMVVVAQDGAKFATGYGYSTSLHLDGNIISSDHPSPWAVCLWETANRSEFVRLDHTREKPSKYETALAFSRDGQRLAIGHFTGEVVVLHLLPQASNPLKPKQLRTYMDFAAAWNALSATDSEEGYSANWHTLLQPRTSTVELGQRLKPIPGDRKREVDQLVIDVGHKLFAVRQAAEQRLRKLGRSIEPTIRNAYFDAGTPDARKRLLDVLAAITSSAADSEFLRNKRAVAILEMIRTDAARDVLRKVADGATGFALTMDAKAALARLER